MVVSWSYGGFLTVLWWFGLFFFSPISIVLWGVCMVKEEFCGDLLLDGFWASFLPSTFFFVV